MQAILKAKREIAGNYTTIVNNVFYSITSNKYAVYGYKWEAHTSEEGMKSFFAETKTALLEDMTTELKSTH